MPTILTHTAVPLALGIGLGSKKISRCLLVAGIAAAILPDFDVVGFRLHIAYGDLFGHRGFTHSMLCAFCIALIATTFARTLHSGRLSTLCFVGICTLSHGLLDMLTNGGLGVALWSPFLNDRLFSAWRVIEVSPIGLRRIMSGRGVEVIYSELCWVWLPASLICLCLIFCRRINKMMSENIIR
ncbi:metal-dependent hydrolase [Undibacterium sp. Xuan67W]|uniref:metal-dependent hydrolase n=1 Tax=Undibacterium sp. Xuan67W TaxID=3413057 RepID=UPI003BF1C276